MEEYLFSDTEQKIKRHIDFKGSLNVQQYEVVTKGEGLCLVLAGAGSGKTRTLIYRLAYLLQKGVHPSNILLMTFTNKAAREMQSRVEILLGYKPRNLWSGTFHHIGNRTLRLYARSIGFTEDYSILDEHDSQELVKTCIRKTQGLSKENKFPKAQVVQSIISLCVNTGKTIKRVLDERYPYFMDFAEEINAVKTNYEKRKEEARSMDYDDLLFKWKLLLEKVPEALSKFSEQFRYIMVDEYQDTNLLQAEIIEMLGKHHRNILVVGDDAQSIYSFRGARVENILRFPERFEGTKIYKLEVNYRSTPEILELANDSLVNNDKQFEKELKAVNPSFALPVLVEVRDIYGEAGFVAQRVKELHDEGVSLKDIAVLFRAHYQSAELEMELVKKGIPYIVRGGIRFFEQAHIKDVLAYVRIIANPLDETAWLRALSLCPRIGPGYAERIFAFFRNSSRDLMAFIRSQNVSEVIPLKAAKGYADFHKIMQIITRPGLEKHPGEILKNVLDAGYENYILSAYENAKDRMDDLYELINFSIDYDNVNDFLSDITLREGFRGEFAPQDTGGYLVLSTIHQAKGLEWDAVMVIGLSEGQFPHPKALKDSSELEEERRLFYVAVTRAKKFLYLIYPHIRRDYKLGAVAVRRSRFLEELSRDDYRVLRVASSAAGIADESTISAV